MALPTLTPEQRDAALAKAREARQARSNLLADITSGQDTVPAVLARAQSDPVAGKTKVSQLVGRCPVADWPKPAPCSNRQASPATGGSRASVAANARHCWAPWRSRSSPAGSSP